jgi:hypothetical protein
MGSAKVDAGVVMTEFILPETVASQLQRLPYPVKLCSPSGETLGCFVPAVDPSLYEIEGGDLTVEELRAIEQSTDWYSTEEVLQHLEKLQ